MRPVRLELDGFGAFVERTVVDLDEVEVFALVGPTGAGKSTLLDAICFALYGTVPRYDDQRLVAAAMSLGANETRVRLTFDVAGTRYDAVRVVRRARDGKVTTKEARLEVAGGDVLAGRASEMAAAVERVVGLPFEHFTRCVVLPQGDFARFLHDKPADRQQLLVQLLDLGVYERVAAEANRRARAADLEAEVAERQAARLAHATDEAVRSAEARLAGLAAGGEQLAALEHEDAERRAAHAALAGELATCEQAHARLAAIAPPAGLADLDAELARTLAEEQAAERDAAEAAGALEQARAERAALGDVGAAAALVARHGERPGLQRELEHRRAALATAVAAAHSAGQALADEEKALADAVAALEEARVASAAHAVREHLVPGRACPVCEQTVTRLPETDPPPAWQLAREAEQRQRARVEEVRRSRDAAVAARAAAEAEEAAAAGALARLDADLGAHGGIDTARAALAEAARLEAAERTALDADAAARRTRAAASRAVEAARARLASLADAYHAQRDAVAALAPPPPTGDLPSDWAALADWASGHAAEHQARQVELAALRAAVERELAAVEREVDGLTESLGLPRASGAGAARAGLERAVGEASVGLERLRVELESRIEEEAVAARHRAAAQVARRLAQLLSATGFERWLVAEATERLVARASVTLEQLSSGQYALALEASGELSVIDHLNAGERRSVRTLSGGETFQAALALALALADQLRELSARTGTTLESLFLDEGFGTLDPDSLDIVAGTLEALGGHGRTVGVVTHVRELAARLPVRFEVVRTPAGSVVRREGP